MPDFEAIMSAAQQSRRNGAACSANPHPAASLSATAWQDAWESQDDECQLADLAAMTLRPAKFVGMVDVDGEQFAHYTGVSL